MLNLTAHQKAILDGDEGRTRQMGMRLLVDLAATAGAQRLIPIESAHLSGVSPLTGGLGLRQFLARIATDTEAGVAVPTTLNSAGCDEGQFSAMRIIAPDFLAHHQEIITLYSKLGVRPTQSCIPYEWDGVVTSGNAAWAESNAICFGNSYSDLITNRESGLSALAAALTGYTADYGLLQAENRQPNIAVTVTAQLSDPADFSILGDWIGKQKQAAGWALPLGPIPYIKGLGSDLSHEQRKALTAAAANYGCPLLYLETIAPPPEHAPCDYKLHFTPADLTQRYTELAPQTAVSLITIGCPQASIGELRATAALLQNKTVYASPDNPHGLPPLWIFTSDANREIARKTGIAKLITASGALLLANTCPEVVPYDPSWVQHILTNSMKAEHYIKSGLNGIPTSVLRLADCIALATGEQHVTNMVDIAQNKADAAQTTTSASQTVEESAQIKADNTQKTSHYDPTFHAAGKGLPSQTDFVITGEAFVTPSPITFLGFVNRETGVIEEAGHPANGESMAGKIAIFPKGSGSTVAPYVLLELFYRGKAPLAIANSDIDQQSAPACSLESIPYAYGFDDDIIANIPHGAQVELRRQGNRVTLRRLAK